MIFINGVELKGWTAPDALVRAVEALAQVNPPQATSASDRPPLAAERYLADWEESPRKEVPPRILSRAKGPAHAPVTIVVVGDYAEPGSVEADAAVRALLAEHGEGMRYAFAHFPMNQACNSSVTFTKFESSCLSARAAQGALSVGGGDAFWRAHEWLMLQGARVKPDSFADGAAATGLDPGAWIASMSSQGVEQAIQDDARESLALGLTSIPAVYINGRLAPNWKVKQESLLPRLVDRARGVK
jgi:protein-disulfide isomerase